MTAPAQDVTTGTRVAEQGLEAAHARLLADRSLQFERTDFVPPEPPAWLGWLVESLAWLAPYLKWVFWIGLIAIAVLVLWAIGREVLKIGKPMAKAEAGPDLGPPEWRPTARDARDLLAEADAMASSGQYAEAAHLILLRSVADIERRKPRALRVSLTAREIAALPVLPDAARDAFVRIAGVVERSLFGGRPVDAEEFTACRDAYEAFALPEGWQK